MDEEKLVGHDGQLWPMTFDAAVWAVEFNKMYPSVPVDEALAWMANAIMRGYDEANWRRKEPTIESTSGVVVTVTDDRRLQMSVGVDILANAVTYHPYFDNGSTKVEVLSADELAAEMVEWLATEDEDGLTPVTRMLDDVVVKVIENGCDSVELINEDPSQDIF